MKLKPPDFLSEHSLLAMVTAVCVLLTVVMTGIEPQLAPDSSSYLSFAPTRPLGYPLFLDLFRTSSGLINLELVIVSHWCVFLIANLVLVQVLRRLVGPILAFLVMIILTANPFLIEYHQKVLTESLFISACILVVAMVYHLLNGVTIGKLAAYAAICCLAYWLRPVALALPALLIVLIPLLWSQYKQHFAKHTIALLAPLVIFIAIDTLGMQIVHGDAPTESLIVNHAFGKAALVSDDAYPQYPVREDPRKQVEHALEQGFAGVRQVIENAPNTPVAMFLSSNYEVFAQYQLARQPEFQLQSIPNLRSLQYEVAISRLTRNPGQYLKLVWLNFNSCWTITTFGDYFFAESTRSYLDRLDHIPFAHTDVLPDPKQPTLPAVMITLAIWLVGVFTTVIVPIGYFAFPRHRTIHIQLIFLFSVLINGYFLLISLTGIGIPRYALAAFPLMLVIGTLTLYELLRRVPLFNRLLRLS